MLGHRVFLVTFTLLGAAAPARGSTGPEVTARCFSAADSILALSGPDGGSSSWSGAAGLRSVRRVTRALSDSSAGYTPTCLLAAEEATARDAVARNPRSVDLRYALAVVLGLRADREGGRTKVRAAAALYDQLRVILAMDPGHVGAHHLMGRLEAGVMRMNRMTRWLAIHLLGGNSLKGASWAGAERNLAFAVARAPDVPDYRYELAHLYEDTGRPGLALVEARKVLAMDPSSALEGTVHAKAAALVARLEATSGRGGG